MVMFYYDNICILPVCTYIPTHLNIYVDMVLKLHKLIWKFKVFKFLTVKFWNIPKNSLWMTYLSEIWINKKWFDQHL